MTSTLRIAVRKFDAFESAIAKQFAAFVAASGVDAWLDAVAMDLNPMEEALFARRELADGSFDIAFLSTDWLARAQADGLILDLRPWLASAPVKGFPEGWSSSLLQLQQFEGGFWGMPYHDGPQCLIYRRDLLQAAGIGVPETWDAFHAAARALHAPDQEQYGTVLALFPDGHNGFYDFCIHVWTRGGEPFAADGTPTLVTPQAVAALDFIRRLANDQDAMAPDARTLDSVQSGLLFCAGKVALMTNWFGFAALGETWAESRVKGLVDVAPIPCAPGGQSLSLNVFWVLAIASGSRNKDLAWRFLRHLATPAMDRLTTTEGAIGVRRSTWSDPEVNRTIPYYHKLDALHAQARSLPVSRHLAAIAHVVDDMLAQATTTAEPSAALLERAQRQILEIVR
ncbi:MAG TPA: extracellular solute-binding protein [Geminicoccus sp.]|uniref:extracellular solute-binding protein n=1 Tax=Geminicoccus sp. TaxID=2024832 RepID=UPI002E374FA6|nr:extracellular solute-binding protein [Geminicoccus sp.]HEX2524991.1 extracellular solute-binding protein [Geminicoccus sp.]